MPEGYVAKPMTTESCINCGDPATNTYELLVRSTNHREVPLCEECHEAIQREIAESTA